MVCSIGKTFTYNNYQEASAQDQAQKSTKPSPRIEVKLIYSDKIDGESCNRNIVTQIKQNFSPLKSMDDLYPRGNLFDRETKWPFDSIRQGTISRGQSESSWHSKEIDRNDKKHFTGCTNEQRYYEGCPNLIDRREQKYFTSCFDWDAALDGHAHIRMIAAKELPGLEPKPYTGPEVALECIRDTSVEDGFDFEDRVGCGRDEIDYLLAETKESLNRVALTTFAVIAISVFSYGIFSLYKRCT